MPAGITIVPSTAISDLIDSSDLIDQVHQFPPDIYKIPCPSSCKLWLTTDWPTQSKLEEWLIGKYEIYFSWLFSIEDLRESMEPILTQSHYAA